jgi:hypothetical protein
MKKETAVVSSGARWGGRHRWCIDMFCLLLASISLSMLLVGAFL